MNKLYPLAVLAILLIGMVPFAIAEEGSDSGSDSAESDGDDDADDSTRSESGKRKRVELRTELREKRGELQETRERLRIREESGDARTEIREERKTRFGDLRSQLKEACKENKDSAECNALKDDLKGEAKAHLLAVAERMLAALSNTKTKIEASEMDADAKARIITGIDARISAVAAVKAEIDVLPESPTREQVKELAKELRDAWKESRKALRTGVGRMVNHRMAGIIEKSEHLTARLEKTLEKLEAKGLDISGIEADVDAFNQLIVDAKAAHAESVSLFASGDVDAAKAKMDEARQKLKDAHVKLKAIVVAIKETNDGNLGTADAGATA